MSVQNTQPVRDDSEMIETLRVGIFRDNDRSPVYELIDANTGEEIGRCQWLNINGEHPVSVSGMELSAGYQNGPIVIELTNTGAYIHLPDT